LLRRDGRKKTVPPSKSPQVPENVRRYYDRNTRLFQSLGRQKRTGSMHRAVWAQGISDFNAALNYTNRLILGELGDLLQRGSQDRLQVIDLGCGVGGSLFYLAANLGEVFSGVGITISPLQARQARASASRLGYQSQCAFLEADFLELPFRRCFNAAYAIESLAHATNPGRFFEQVAGALRPGGRLVVCDDFLAGDQPSGRLPAGEQFWLQAFQQGWHTHNLTSHREAIRLAESQGLDLLSALDLTPHLRFSPIPTWLASWLVRIWLRLDPAHPYWGSLLGGLALQNCLKKAVTVYQLLVFEKQG
jgi:cyclopropane fatty-acyl-phospholipid synthase-like methyltransferase